MKFMTSNELRQAFLAYFQQHGHRVVASSPLVPGNDKTLLFTNAGMVQFKDVFLGDEKRTYNRAATSQRCVRAGGKHNDLENVGYTARHHTFFEMLGNFSFGDYFKEVAIKYAWEFLTEVLGLPEDRLWVTVYEEDDEAAEIWLNNMKISPERFSRLGKKDNYWSMGDTGPCGPCSEIFFDHGADIPGGPPGSPDEDGDRYVEIWNLVFMQFDQGSDGKLTPLPKPSVDTGMGLERIAAVMQGVHSNYEIDLFANLIEAAAAELGVANDGSKSLNVIADHIRASSFLIVDGVLPGNEDRGYVLRRIIRRAIRHGHKLGVKDVFFYKLVRPLVEQMGVAYPLLATAREHVEKVLQKEERRFIQTLDQGLEILDAELESLSGTVIPGDLVFRLYDTYGFPVDLTADIARERGLTVDQAGFEADMEAQRERARGAHKFSAADQGDFKSDLRSDFRGYVTLQEESSVAEAFRDGVSVDKMGKGERGAVILHSTPFYAESGGQVGDTGTLAGEDFTFIVEDTQKSGEAIAHFGEVTSGELNPGDVVNAIVDSERRADTVLNHSATHLLHAALRTVLGDHVQQKGSLVAPNHLRFDFSHYEPVSTEQLQLIESMVNDEVRKNAAAEVTLMPYDDAIAAGVTALFGEKYGDEVRVLRLGDSSVELCGGTHVSRTGDIGVFKIVSEHGVASGVRRIEARSGRGALKWIADREQTLERAAGQLKGTPEQLSDKIDALQKRTKELEKELAAAKQALITGAGSSAADDVVEVDGVKVLAARVDGADAKTLRDAVDRYKDKLGTAVVVLGSVDGGKVRLAAGVTKNTTDKIKAGDVIQPVAEQVGGRGGGRPDFAQAGGSDPDSLDSALASVRDWVSERLN